MSVAGSDHFDGKRYFNPNGANGQPFRNLPRLLRTPRMQWPANVAVSQRRPPTAPSGDDVSITFIGHSTFLIQTADGNVITDPVYAKRAGPFGIIGPTRVRAPGIAFDDLPEINTVLLSHNHYDHCDLAALAALAKRYAPVFITPIGNAKLLRRTGAQRIEELDWWERTNAAPFAVTATPAQHFSARTPFDRNRALWSGFVLQLRSRTLYFAGDTGFMPYFREIGTRLGPIDIAILPIGAYEPRWFMKDIHMNPEEAVDAHVQLGARESIACHFGTFQLTPEGIDDPVHALRAALSARGIAESDFRVLQPGETFEEGGGRRES